MSRLLRPPWDGASNPSGHESVPFSPEKGGERPKRWQGCNRQLRLAWVVFFIIPAGAAINEALKHKSNPHKSGSGETAA